jgi:transposase
MKEIVPHLDYGDKILMEKLLTAGFIAHKYARRLQIILYRAQGKSAQEIADNYRIGRSTVSTLVNRYNSGGIAALLRDKTRKPGKAPLSEALKNSICETACHEKPENATHWSVRTLAEKYKVGKTTVNTLLRERGIKPHLVKTFKFSTGEHFQEKLTDVAGL